MNFVCKDALKFNMFYNVKNKKRNDMKKEIEQIVNQVSNQTITTDEAIKELCVLFNVIVTLPNNDEVIKKAWNYGDKCTGDSFNKFMCDGAYKEGANWIIGLINKDKQGN